MHLFISAGEPSGDLHGANLARALQERCPGLRITGFGGERLAAAGAELLYPLTDLAIMGFGRVLWNLPSFFRIARQAEVHFRSVRPDAVILIDYPGFHWAIAKRAHRAGVPVYYFVPPQLWAWAGWRVAKMRRWVRTVLAALPFEVEWYRSRGVDTRYVGHPYFDEIGAQVIDHAFVAAQRQGNHPLVALLPGSRTQEVTGNFPEMLAAAARIREAIPDVRFLVPAFKEAHAQWIRERLAGSGLPIEVFVGRTPDVIEAADVCIAVSGSVGLELMCRLKPAVVVYRVTPMIRWLGQRMLTCRYISLVNLLADAEIYPEYITTRDNPEPLARHVIEWLRNPAARNAVVEQLRSVRDRTATPGACERAAEVILSDLQARGRSRLPTAA